MPQCQILFYSESDGNQPVQSFLDQHPTVKSKAMRIFLQIKTYGLISAIPHLKKLNGTPLWELRILGQESARILYISQHKDSIIVLHAFLKKTQKTPIKEIKTALKRLSKI